MVTQASTKLTYADLLELPEDGKRYEIIDGELCVSPSPFVGHQRIAGRIFAALFDHFNRHGGGETLIAPLDVVLAEDAVVQPDVVVITSARAELVGEKNIAGPPDIVIEVLSDGTRRVDEIVKRKLYERYGVDEYWIADPVVEIVKIYRRVGNAFERVAEIGTENGGDITTPLLPEFALDVRVVFAQ
jgi:Uma2 family endonuclease